MANIIDQLEAEQLENRDIPDFAPGDTVVVHVKVKEGERERVQAFEGVVIAKRNRGLNSAFTVRKISYGEGVERVFQTYSHSIDKIEVKRRGDVRRAKLYYLRGRTGKSARIKEKISYASKAAASNAAVETAAEAATNEALEKAESVVTETTEVVEDAPIAAPAVTGNADDLTKIEGVGPKVQEALNEKGVSTYAQVAELSADQIKEMITEVNSRLASRDTGTWPKQAELARDDKWDELQTWQDELNGGK